MRLIPKHQTGKILTREGDPFQYQKSGNQYLYKDKGATKWTTADASRKKVIEGLFNSPQNPAAVQDKGRLPFNKSSIGKYINTIITPGVNPADAMSWDFNNPSNPSNPTNTKLMEANQGYHQKRSSALQKSEDQIAIEAKQDMLRQAGYKIATDGKWGKLSEAAYKDFAEKQKNNSQNTPKPEQNAVTKAWNSVGGDIRNFGLRHTGYVGGALITQAADALGINAPMDDRALSDTDKRMILEWSKNRPMGTSVLGYGDTTGSNSNTIVNPYDYKPFKDEALNDSRRKIGAIYGNGVMIKTPQGVTIAGGDYDYNEGSYIAPVIDKWNAGSTLGNKMLSAAQGFDRKYVAPLINTVDYDERSMIPKIDENGRQAKDTSGKLILVPNANWKANVEKNKTRTRGAELRATIPYSKKGSRLIKRK